MSGSSDIQEKLKALQCHFTWKIDPSEISRPASKIKKLLDRIKFSPDRCHAIYFNIIAFLSHLEGDNGTALGYLREAEEILKERKDDTELLVTYGNYAWVHYHSDNLEEVRVYLEKVEEITKTLPQEDTLSIIHGQKGWTFLCLNKSMCERSRESFEKALEGEPENVSHNVGYAVVLYRLESGDRWQGRFGEQNTEASIQLEKALKLEPDNAMVMVLLALKLQLEERDSERALRLITQALEIAPDAPQITRHVGKYFRLAGRVEESLEVLHKALDLTPNSSALNHRIGLCHRQLTTELRQIRAPTSQIIAQAEECIHYFSKVLELNPSRVSAKVDLAKAFGDAQRVAEGERIFKELLEDDRVKDVDRQHCLVQYGLFLMYRKRNNSAAVAQLRLAYQMPIQSSNREKAGVALQKLAGWMGAWESREILDFLKCEDDKQREIAEEAARSKMAASAITKMVSPGGTKMVSDDADDLVKGVEKELKPK